MNRLVRSLILAASFALTLHLILSNFSANYTSTYERFQQTVSKYQHFVPQGLDDPRPSTSSHGLDRYKWRHDQAKASNQGFTGGESEHDPTRPKAAFVILVRNTELGGLMRSIQTLEWTFNSKPRNRYPYILLNDQPFTNRFKREIEAVVSSSVQYGELEEGSWGMPEWINRTLAEKKWEKAKKSGMIYGGSESYRNMCRFQSGFFWRHPLLDGLEYYWRIEPDVRYFCDLEDFDPFRFMKEKQKKYGWVLSLHEFPYTVVTLWLQTLKWMEKNPHHIARDNALGFVTDDKRRMYNKCHFWSNFEIADLSFFRSEAYRSYFDHLDRAGGFYYERWGDAPIHSIAASMLLSKDEIHYFDNIGYFHKPYMHCPKDPPGSRPGRCACLAEESIDYDPGKFSCLYQWDELMGRDSLARQKEIYNVDWDRVDSQL
ncbi:glycosyl transferase [Violaceomyces palustris]|uniref:Glycosyl transferase n=1 Tax=Violaceomyces palustris TaxID=1673888 RepID=A0ACD0NNG3_9BASI|nr:glycosyl transferase [Violaceomyces palustris]